MCLIYCLILNERKWGNVPTLKAQPRHFVPNVFTTFRSYGLQTAVLLHLLIAVFAPPAVVQTSVCFRLQRYKLFP